ncbi:hypothetical protein BD779DRAFT_1441584, partial [Infundibulicybe gibba]
IVMHEQKCNLDGASAWISHLHGDLVETFLPECERVPIWGLPALDAQVAEYVRGIGNWVRANECWSFEGERYFGTAGPQVQRNRAVRLLPKRSSIAN